MLGGSDKWEKYLFQSNFAHVKILLTRTWKILGFVFIVGEQKSFAYSGILRW